MNQTDAGNTIAGLGVVTLMTTFTVMAFQYNIIWGFVVLGVFLCMLGSAMTSGTSNVKTDGAGAGRESSAPEGK